MWCIFRLSNLFSLEFFKIVIISFTLDAKTIKKLWKSSEWKDKEKQKTKTKITFNSKKEFVRGHSFMTSVKISIFRTHTHLFPSIHNHPILKFWSKQIPLLNVLNSHSTPSPSPPPPTTLVDFEQLFNC